MKVIFNCTIFDFHKSYYIDIAKEIERRGGCAIFEYNKIIHEDANFTIQADEGCERLGGKGVWINHAIPVIPQNDFYLGQGFKNDLLKNSDYIFVYSSEWVKDFDFGLPVYVSGLPKLDTLFDVEKEGCCIFYAPTWNPGLNSKDVVNLDELKGFGEVIYKGHPAFNSNNISTEESLKKATIVISDYSSVGLESIVLNIPTILIDMPNILTTNHISNQARKAAICVKNQSEISLAIKQYIENPKFLEQERLYYSSKLCEYQKNAAKRIVDILEKL